MGRGDRRHSDQVAVEAMRKEMDNLPMDGRVVIGEGERDKAPMLYVGEELGALRGQDGATAVDIAVDPLEGTNLCATGSPDSIAVLAASERGGLLYAPDVYMDKIVVGPDRPRHRPHRRPGGREPAQHRRRLRPQGERPDHRGARPRPPPAAHRGHPRRPAPASG